MMVVAIFGGLVGLMVIGVPIAISLALTAAATMYWMGGADLMIMLAQRMYASTTSFPLLAIPFFIFAGNLMNTGGMTHRLFAVAHMLVGRIHGGLGHVNVLASMLFAGMSGSAVADAVGLGKIEIEAMRRAGYSTRFAAAISAVSSTIGPVIPPSIPFVIYGSLANVSVGALFLAGVVPGVLMGLAMMIAIAVIARYRDLPLSEARPRLRVAAALLGDAVPALMMPFIVIGGILSGFFTPTEAAVVASLYSLALGLLFYRELKPSNLPEILWATGKETAQVLIIIAAAGALGWVMVQQRIPNAIINAILELSTSPWVVLLLVNAVLLVLGCFMESIAIMLIAVPIFVPLMERIGVDLVHFGAVMVLNLMIGLVTPPVGLCLYAISSVSNVPISALLAEIWPYLLALLVVLGIVTFVPEFSTWLPKQFGLGG
jgi:C4-dicarboxylate transporter DctM subunit